MPKVLQKINDYRAVSVAGLGAIGVLIFMSFEAVAWADGKITSRVKSEVSIQLNAMAHELNVAANRIERKSAEAESRSQLAQERAQIAVDSALNAASRSEAAADQIRQTMLEMMRGNFNPTNYRLDE